MSNKPFKLIAGNMGEFTMYDIEYVAEYLGEERINLKIEELMDKPTMGIRLADFVMNRPLYSSVTGVFQVFGNILGYFEDVDLAEFLFEKSHSYNYENYYGGKNTNHNLEQVANSYQKSINHGRDVRGFYKYKIKNHYWEEYHFLIHNVVDILYKPNTKPLNYPLLDKIFNEYYIHLDTITTEMKEPVMWPENGLGNSVLKKMANFYKKQGDKDRYTEIKERGKSLGWRI